MHCKVVIPYANQGYFIIRDKGQSIYTFKQYIMPLEIIEIKAGKRYLFSSYFILGYSVFMLYALYILINIQAIR